VVIQRTRLWICNQLSVDNLRVVHRNMTNR
jgi:hypothetical protein